MKRKKTSKTNRASDGNCAAAGPGKITSVETSIAKDLCMQMWKAASNPDGTADGNRIVGILSTMIATIAVNLRPESEMDSTIDDIAYQAKAWADRATATW